MQRLLLVQIAVGQPNQHVEHVLRIDVVAEPVKPHVLEVRREHKVELSLRPAVHRILYVLVLRVEGPDGELQQVRELAQHLGLGFRRVDEQLEEVVDLPVPFVQHQIGHLFHQVLHEVQVQLLLVLEVEEQKALRDACPARDRLGRGVLVIVLAERFHGGADDGLAPLFGKALEFRASVVHCRLLSCRR